MKTRFNSSSMAVCGVVLLGTLALPARAKFKCDGRQLSRVDGGRGLTAATYVKRRLRNATFCSSWLSAIAVALAVALPVSDAFADARAGEKKAQLCTLCHRVESTTGAPTLEQQPSSYLAAQTNLFKSGKRIWPAMQANVASLSAKDVQDISDYFSSQQAKPARFVTEPEPKTIALGASSAKQLNCGSCHLENYRGEKGIPRLAGQVPNYLERQISEFKRGVRPHPAIPAAAEKLNDPTIEALAVYLGKLEP